MGSVGFEYLGDAGANQQECEEGARGGDSHVSVFDKNMHTAVNPDTPMSFTTNSIFVYGRLKKLGPEIEF